MRHDGDWPLQMHGDQRGRSHPAAMGKVAGETVSDAVLTELHDNLPVAKNNVAGAILHHQRDHG